MIELSDNELNKLSEALDVPYDAIQKLYSMRMLHEPTTFNVLMKHDFNRLKRMAKYKPGQIITAIAGKYCVSQDRVRNAVYSKAKRQYYCSECGKRISSREYARGDGRCESCVAKSIEV